MSDGASLNVVSSSRGPLATRLYGLALGSVVMSLLLAVVVARVREPPPHPGMVRSALSRLQTVLDEPAARAAELERLRDDADLELALYATDRTLVASSLEPAPPLPTDLPRPRDRDGRFGRDDDRGPSEGPPPAGMMGNRDGRKGNGHDGPRPWMWPLSWSSTSFVHAMTASSGEIYYVVHVRPGEWPLVLLSIVGVILLLGVLSVVFATTLARPLRELGRATAAFGQGDVNTRVDLKKAGPFAELGQTFNKMADKVTSSRRAERELLANVSHELRTPLSRIRVALDLADEGDPLLARESLAEIGSDLSELETIIEDILTATRLESGQLTTPVPLRLASTSLTTLIDAVAARFRTAHPRHTLVVDIEPSLPPVVIDAVLVRRALDNFVDNAGKYAAPASTVQVTARRDGDAVVVAIVDRGAGISVDDQAKLFTPFFRADKSRTRSTGGVGLGLVLSRRIVEAHAGTVVLTSTVGIGTTVTVRLPV